MLLRRCRGWPLDARSPLTRCDIIVRVLLIAIGTRGDVQPALALALRLRAHGHAVTLCVSPNFVAWAERLGFEAVPLGVEMRMPSPSAGAAPSLTPEALERLRASMPDLVANQFDVVGPAAVGCDAIIGANAHQYAAPSVAEQLGIACVTAVYAPTAFPSDDLAPPPAPGVAMPTPTAEPVPLQWQWVASSWNARALERVNQQRTRLGLALIDDVLDYALSPQTWLAADAVLAPLPATARRTIVQTGAWVLPDEKPLAPEVERFLDAGEPPIYIGFGSMPISAEVAEVILRTMRAVQRRVVMVRGWAGLALESPDDDCLIIDDVNHARLFPRVAMVVHHGGAGTTAAAARAGVPQLITPMFGDQFYWAARVEALGVGAQVMHAGVTPQALTDAFARVRAPATIAHARALTAQLMDDGTDHAAQIVDMMGH